MRLSLLFVTALLWAGAISLSLEARAQDNVSTDDVVQKICSDGGEWLKCYSLEPSKCRTVTTAFVDPCVKRVMSAKIDEHAMKTVTRLLTCFNQEFMGKYGYGEVKTPECKNPMKHLTQPSEDSTPKRGARSGQGSQDDQLGSF